MNRAERIAERCNRFKCDINRLQTELGKCQLKRQVWDYIEELADKNEWITDPSLLYDVLSSSYYDSMAMYLRRMMDAGKQSLNYRSLLQRIACGDVQVTREWHVEKHVDGNLDNHFGVAAANAQFDNLAGTAAPIFSPAIAQKDIERIEHRYGKLKEWVDRRLAHLDKAEEVSVPLIRHMRHALVMMQVIHAKYVLLVTGKGIMIDDIAISVEWRQPLWYPWERSSVHYGLSTDLAMNKTPFYGHQVWLEHMREIKPRSPARSPRR